MKKNILIIPCSEPGKGGGHLTRCMQLTTDLRALGKQALLYLQTETEHTDRLFQSMNFNPEWRITKEQTANSIEFIILDRFQTPLDELLHWKELAPVIGIDEGGQYRDNFDFLIDILIPEKYGYTPANIASPALLIKGNRKQKTGNNKPEKSAALKILISFGQEDSAGLGIALAQKLAAKNYANMDITLLRGGLSKPGSLQLQIPNTIKVVEAIPNLAEHLADYDLVITHYGITAYEALFSGTPVLLAHPTAYHKKLAKAAGFLGIKHLDTFIKSALPNTNKCVSLAAKYKPEDGTNLASLINGFSPIVNRLCPVCGSEAGKRSIARFSERTYRKCKKCGVIFMDRIKEPPVEYEREYFFEHYKQQYGKTYLEDFDNIKSAAKRRLKTIKTFLHTESKNPALLDIGCAYGPFLAASREEGFFPAGIDPAEDAVRYVQEKLNIPAVHGFFPHCSLPTANYSPLAANGSLPTANYSQTYDVISLWYVIEHFRDCAPVLTEIRKLLKQGGILAFSTPSYSGISGHSSPGSFFSKSPADHWTIWSPKMCKKALAFAGFKVKKITISGHHPERFPLFGKFAKSKKSPLHWLLLAISKILGLGDTFEVYAENVSQSQ